MDGSMFRGVGEAMSLLFWLAAAASIGCIALLGYVVWDWTTTPDWQREAIQRGFALYCPGNGEFAWKGECEPDTTTKER